MKSASDDAEQPAAAHDWRVKRVIFGCGLLCILSITPCLLSLVPALLPKGQQLNEWFMRSGAGMTVFALLAQGQASNLKELIAGGTFAESWSFFEKYHTIQNALSWTSLILAIAGAIVWGYGDLLLRLAE